MTRTIPLALLLLLLPTVGWAQGDLNGLVTGVESAPPEAGGPGLDPAQLTQYLQAVEAADMALQINARGETRRALGVDSLNVEASWADRGNGSPELTALTVRPGVPPFWGALRALPESSQRQTIAIDGLAESSVSRIRHRDDYTELTLGGRRRVRYYADGRISRSNGRGFRTVQEPQRLGGRLNEVTFRDGVMRLDISGAPDLTIEKVTWELNRDGERRMRMHVNFWPDLIVEPDGTVNINAFGGIEVGKMEALTRLNRWPPTAEDLQQAFMSGSRGQAQTPARTQTQTPARSGTQARGGTPAPTRRGSGARPSTGGGTGITGHDFDVAYQISGRMRPTPFPFTSMMEAGAEFDVRGAVAMRPDGSLTTIGDGNRLTVDLQIGAQNFMIGRHENSTRLSGRTRDSSARLTGTYEIGVPAQGGPMNLRVNGNLAYQLRGSNLTLALPTGTEVRLANGEVTGNSGIDVALGGGQPRVALRDGTYRLTVDGPVSLERLVLNQVRASELDFDGQITSEGTISSAPGEDLVVQGGVQGRLTANGMPERDGAVDVLMGAFQGSGRLRNGSTTELDLEQVTVTLDPIEPNGQPTRIRDVDVQGGRVNAQTTLDGVEFSQDGSEGQLGAVRADADLTFAAGREGGVQELQGTVDTEVLEGGVVTFEGLPGGPVVSGAQPQPTEGVSDEIVDDEAAAPGRVTHTVGRGDTLWALGQRYGVTPAAIKQANGLSSDTIGLGQTLEIPSSGGAAPRTTTPQRRQAPTRSVGLPAGTDGRFSTEVEAGSSARIEIDGARQGPDGLEIDGHVTGLLRLGDADVAVSSVEGRILGQAEASLARTGFTLRQGMPHSLRMGRIQVPVRMDIHPGTHVQVVLPNFPVDVELDRDGSYAEFVAHVVVGPEGTRVERITDADMLITSDAVAEVAGDAVTVAGRKSVRFEGRIELLDNGLDFYGRLAVVVEGDENTPIVRVRW